jgi:protein phosphatase
MQDARAIFETGAATHVGQVRQRNEDSHLAQPEAGIWAVADGMGGHADGDVASQTVIRTLESIGRPASAAALLDVIEDNIAQVNVRLRELGEARGEIIGTTLAVLLAREGYYACLWSGDSRIYLIRGGAIVQLSRDHTEVQDLLAAGRITDEEARSWAGRNGITRAIGVFEEAELEMTSGPLRPGDAFVICSDGLTNHVQEEEILRCVNDNLSQQACDALIALTLARGARDNVTVVIARYRPAEPPGGAHAPNLRERAE